MSMLRQGSKRKSRVQKNPGLWHGDRGLPARAVSPSASARAALWTTRDFGLVADLTVVIKKAARPFSPFDRRAALKVSTQQVTVLLRGRDALTQITKIGCEKAAERPGGSGGEKAGQGPAATLRLILAWRRPEMNPPLGVRD